MGAMDRRGVDGRFNGFSARVIIMLVEMALWFAPAMERETDKLYGGRITPKLKGPRSACQVGYGPNKVMIALSDFQVRPINTTIGLTRMLEHNFKFPRDLDHEFHSLECTLRMKGRDV